MLKIMAEVCLAIEKRARKNYTAMVQPTYVLEKLKPYDTEATFILLICYLKLISMSIKIAKMIAS